MHATCHMATTTDAGQGAGEAAPADASGLERLMAELDGRVPFGPSFFLGHLAGYVRQRCPSPTEALPVVEVHLMGGEVLDVCHVIGVTPAWVALAVFDSRDTGGPPAMRTELVPYGAMVRVTIRAAATGGKRVGFFAASPAVTAASAEALLAKAAGVTP